jgi:hypothetical protein
MGVNVQSGVGDSFRIRDKTSKRRAGMKEKK